MIFEEIKKIDLSKKKNREFAFLIAIVLSVFAIFTIKNGDARFVYFSVGASFLFFFIGGLFPGILKPVLRTWMTVAILIGWFMSRVLLTALFYLIVTPIGFLLKLLKKDLLSIKIEKSVKTYWKQKQENKNTSCEKQF